MNNIPMIGTGMSPMYPFPAGGSQLPQVPNPYSLQSSAYDQRMAEREALEFPALSASNAEIEYNDDGSIKAIDFTEDRSEMPYEYPSDPNFDGMTMPYERSLKDRLYDMFSNPHMMGALGGLFGEEEMGRAPAFGYAPNPSGGGGVVPFNQFNTGMPVGRY